MENLLGTKYWKLYILLVHKNDGFSVRYWSDWSVDPEKIPLVISATGPCPRYCTLFKIKQCWLMTYILLW